MPTSSVWASPGRFDQMARISARNRGATMVIRTTTSRAKAANSAVTDTVRRIPNPWIQTTAGFRKYARSAARAMGMMSPWRR
jgi:hypothetical protein